MSEQKRPKHKRGCRARLARSWKCNCGVASEKDERTIFGLMSRPLVAELRTEDFSGVLRYAADVMRLHAKNYHAEDPGETSVARANIRTLAARLARVAKSLEAK